MQETISTNTDWPAHIKAWQGTGASQSAYCQQHQLRRNQFTYWKLKLLGSSSKVPSSSNLVPVRLAATSLCTLKVMLPNGLLLEGSPPAELAELAKLLRSA